MILFVIQLKNITFVTKSNIAQTSLKQENSKQSGKQSPSLAGKFKDPPKETINCFQRK